MSRPVGTNYFNTFRVGHSKSQQVFDEIVYDGKLNESLQKLDWRMCRLQAEAFHLRACASHRLGMQTLKPAQAAPAPWNCWCHHYQVTRVWPLLECARRSVTRFLCPTAGLTPASPSQWPVLITDTEPALKERLWLAYTQRGYCNEGNSTGLMPMPRCHHGMKC